MRMPTLTQLTAALALSALPAVLHAQGPGARAAAGPATIISVNPFLPLFGYGQGEFEAKLRDNMAFAVSASHTKLEDTYTNADVKLRLYPQEKGLEGLALAAGLGYGKVSNVESTFCLAIDRCTDTRRSASGATFSVETHYQWLLGRSRNTAVALGAGVKRYYVDDSPDGYDAFDTIVPTFRITIGYAFK